MNIYSYTQESKNKIRHKVFLYAIDLLTRNRSNACCVERNYVRNLYDYFIDSDEGNVGRESKKIDIEHIKLWESLHDSTLGHKRIEDLVVCYLSGPEPENDFNELIAMGIHPHNIWAFENNTSTYIEAIKSYANKSFPQPKIVKGSIEHFFKNTPKKFDIIYIDACGAVVSQQHALKIISSMIKFHRLNSPGIAITNFARPDISNNSELEDYAKLMASYFAFKNNVIEIKTVDKNKDIEEQIEFITSIVKNDFENYYSEFITRSLMDIGSVIVPALRFINSDYIGNIIENNYTLPKDLDEVTSFYNIENNSMLEFFTFNDLLSKNIFSSNLGSRRFTTFINELQGLDGYSKDVYSSIRQLANIKNGKLKLKTEIEEIKVYFDKSNNIYQFLDKPTNNLFFDLVINQLSYPMHYNCSAWKRFKYIAKSTPMFTDICVFDECRYIYEWLPTIHQIKNVFEDKSWQYVFRFALDGLVKQRLNYNNEYFFQSSVIDKNVNPFAYKTISERISIE